MMLAIDVCLRQCAAAVLSGAEVLSNISEPMERGHAERLPDVVREALHEAEVAPGDLEYLAATGGPGSFTGARLGVAFVRGMALATKAETVGVSSFEALAELSQRGKTLCVLDGRRGELFLQGFREGAPISDPEAVPLDLSALEVVIERMQPDVLIGTGAALLMETLGRDFPIVDEIPSAALVGRAAQRLLNERRAARAKPIYLRAPDAKPSTKALV